MILRLRLRLPNHSPELKPASGSDGADESVRSAPSLRQLDAATVLRALSDAAEAEKREDPNVVTPREMAHGLTHMLTPACAIAYAMCLWRIGEDMGWARSFAIRDGVLSHWQVWFGLGVALQMAIQSLRRFFRNDDDQNQATS